MSRTQATRHRGRAGLAAALAGPLPGMLGAYLIDTPFVDLQDEIQLDAGHRVLQLGCGRAGLLRALDGRVRFRCPPVGVDESQARLRAAARSAGDDVISLAAATTTRLPFAEERFDLVLAAHCFRQLEDDMLFRVLLECRRVLKPGGVLLAWEFAPLSSRLLNRFHAWLLRRRGTPVRLRGFGMLAPYALYAGFKHVNRLQFRTPFLFPPIPRVAVALQKA